MMIMRLAAGFVLAGLSVGSPAAWAADPALPAAHAAPATVVTDQAIRAWLATHPEVVDQLVKDSLLRQPGVLQEVNMAMQAKRQAEQQAKLKGTLATSQAALYDDKQDGRDGAAPGSRSGAGSALASVVIFGDPECPYCKAIQPTLVRLVAEHPEVTVIYKEFPILGPESLFAAKAELAAVAQGKYSAFHAALMASKIPEHQLTDDKVFEMASGAGMDIERLKRDMAAPVIEAKIAANKALGQSLGITGTPGVLIGNQMVPGNVGYERLEQMIAEAKAPVAAADAAAMGQGGR